MKTNLQKLITGAILVSVLFPFVALGDAIVPDAWVDGGYHATMNGANITITATTTANRVLVVSTFGNAGGGDTITNISVSSPSLATTSMTRVNGTLGSTDRYSTIWFLAGVPSGVLSITASASAGDGAIDAGTYAGVSQTGQPEASSSATSAGTNNLGISVTGSVANWWAVASGRLPCASQTAGTNTNGRLINTASGLPFYDGGPFAASAQTLNAVNNCNAAQTQIIIALDPASTSTPVVSTRKIRGVGISR